MTTDITELAQREKFEAWVMTQICISKSTLEGLRSADGYRNSTLSGTNYNRMWNCWKAAGAEMVEALEKAQGMEAYWKTQCRGITDHCEELQARIAELEESHAQVIHARDHYKALWRESLKGARAVTVKLPDDEDGQAYGFGKWSNGKLPATAGTMTISYCEDAWRAAFEVFSSVAGIKVEAE